MIPKEIAICCYARNALFECVRVALTRYVPRTVFTYVQFGAQGLCRASIFSAH
jgi:hypothetical protein